MRKLLKFIFKALLLSAIFFAGSSLLAVVVYRWVPVHLTPLMLSRSVENWGNSDFSTQKKWVPIERISHNMVLAVMASEDNNFMEHSGFDWEAIQRAIEHNKRSKRIQGGSTISQQVAKNVFLWHGRSYLRKGLEVYFTFLIETFWSKERIMEVYLNVIETGNGVYGAEAAARKYFKKPAAKLSKSEAAIIAAILPNPRRWNPNKPTQYILSRQAQIVRLMGLLGEVELKPPAPSKKPTPSHKKRSNS